MFELDLKLLGAFLIGIGVVLKPHIFRRLNVKGIWANVVYFFVIMIIVVPINMYQPRLTLTSMDDESSKKLVEKVLENPLFKGYENVENVQWKPYLADRKVYNIKATIYKNRTPYTIYLEPVCSFFEGCQVGLDKIIIIDDKYKAVSVENMTEDMFLKRDCRDAIVQNILKGRIRFAMKIFSENMNKVPNLSFSHEIKSLTISNPAEIGTNPFRDKMPQNYIYSNSCRADYKMESLFAMDKGFREGSLNASLSVLFDNVKADNNIYKIVSKVDYSIYLKDGEIFIQDMPFNLDKLKKKKKKA